MESIWKHSSLYDSVHTKISLIQNCHENQPQKLSQIFKPNDCWAEHGGWNRGYKPTLT